MMPTHYLFMVPALGRVKGWKQLVLWILLWWFLIEAGIYIVVVKVIALAFPLTIWLFLAPGLKPTDILNDPDIIARRLWRFSSEIFTYLARLRAAFQDA
jgi:hypothetical protein